MPRKWTLVQKEEQAEKLRRIEKFKHLKFKKRQEEYKVILQKDSIYMEEHRKSIELILVIENCIFMCGRLTNGVSDICEICDDVYSAYLMQQIQGGVKMTDENEKPTEDEKKAEEPKVEPSGEEEKKEESTEEKPTEDKDTE